MGVATEGIGPAPAPVQQRHRPRRRARLRRRAGLLPRRGSSRRAAAWSALRAVGIPTGAPPTGSCRAARAIWSWSTTATTKQQPTAASDAGSPLAPRLGRQLGWALRTARLLVPCLAAGLLPTGQQLGLLQAVDAIRLWRVPLTLNCPEF